jgi:hypothetical protein
MHIRAYGLNLDRKLKLQLNIVSHELLYSDSEKTSVSVQTSPEG